MSPERRQCTTQTTQHSTNPKELIEDPDTLLVFASTSKLPQLRNPLEPFSSLFNILSKRHDTAENQIPAVLPRRVERLGNSSLSATAPHQFVHLATANTRTTRRRHEVLSLRAVEHETVRQIRSLQRLRFLLCAVSARHHDGLVEVIRLMTGSARVNAHICRCSESSRCPDLGCLYLDGLCGSRDQFICFSSRCFRAFHASEKSIAGLLVPGLGGSVLKQPLDFLQIGGLRAVRGPEDVTAGWQYTDNTAVVRVVAV